MRSKVMIAGAIAAAALCVLAAAAYSLASQGQVQPQVSVVSSPVPQGQAEPQACSVYGYVVNTTGKGLSGLGVTLHVMSYDNSSRTLKELYTMAAKTDETPNSGRFAFDAVRIPEGTIVAYAETSINVNGTTFIGRSNNYTLKANADINIGGIVLRTQAAPAPAPEDMAGCALIGNVTDAGGHPFGGVNVTVHVIGVLPSTGAVHEVYDQTLTSRDDPPAVGRFTGSIPVPADLGHMDGFVVNYVYADALVRDNGTTLYGRSDNATLKANGTIFLDVACAPSPAPL